MKTLESENQQAQAILVKLIVVFMQWMLGFSDIHWCRGAGDGYLC